jgi:hypothetical protein
MVKSRISHKKAMIFKSLVIDDVFDQGVWFNGCGKYFFQAKESVWTFFIMTIHNMSIFGFRKHGLKHVISVAPLE